MKKFDLDKLEQGIRDSQGHYNTLAIFYIEDGEIFVSALCDNDLGAIDIAKRLDANLSRERNTRYPVKVVGCYSGDIYWENGV